MSFDVMMTEKFHCCTDSYILITHREWTRRRGDCISVMGFRVEGPLDPKFQHRTLLGRMF